MKTLTMAPVALVLVLAGCSRQPEPAATTSTQPPATEAPAAQPPAAAQAPFAEAPASRAAAPKKTAPAKRPSSTAATPETAAPAAAKLPPAAPRLERLPSGTALAVRTTNVISTENAKVGDTFEASLAEPLTVDGRVVAPRNARVEGRVTDIDVGGRVKGKATLAVQLTSLTLADGRSIPVTTNAYVKEAAGTVKKDAAKVGIGAGVGAAIGAIAGGGRGAAIGSAVGGAAGAGSVLATRGAAASIPSETVLNFQTR